jgi:O-antigen/teichoic acid export membrane protein
MTTSSPRQELPTGGSVRKNVVANFVGQGLRAAMGLVFIPLYVSYIGVESYGLVGLFGVLQAWLGLLDLGMRPALSREMARFSAGAVSAGEIRTLLRTVELTGLGIAAAVAAGVWLASGWLATHWVTAKELPVSTVASGFAVMGLVCALRFVENIYVSSVVGLQRQVLENALTASLATLRGVGAIAVLAWVSPTIEAFLYWQALISLLTVVVFGVAVYVVLPRAEQPARFSFEALRGVSNFAAGMLGISIISMVFTQMDKVLLSKLVSLEEFGYFAFAGVAANTLGMLTAPFASALNPRLTELAARKDEAVLASTYHQGAQLVAVLTGSAAVVWAVFSERVLTLWTNNPALVSHTAYLVTVLAIGSASTYLQWIPYGLQLAHGWTTLTLKLGILLVVLIVPALLFFVPKFGPIAAAWIWFTLNTSQLFVSVFLMHRVLLRGHAGTWLVQDTALPIGAATVMALVLRWVVPEVGGRVVGIAVMAIISGLVLISAAAAAPMVRGRVLGALRARGLGRVPGREGSA